MQEADVVLHDRLVSDPIMELIPETIEKIYVGKTSNHKGCKTQDEINAILLEQVEKGHKNIVRLKGGDPYILGRGGEEALYLHERGVGLEVVPGVTSASGSSAAVGFPLTHRGLATSVRYITGHRRNNEPLELDWDDLIDPETTLVVYMGLVTFPEMSARLIEAGMPANTPAAAVENATLPQQRHCISTVKDLSAVLVEKTFVAPTLIIIGRVINVAIELGVPVYGEGRLGR